MGEAACGKKFKQHGEAQFLGVKRMEIVVFLLVVVVVVIIIIVNNNDISSVITVL